MVGSYSMVRIICSIGGFRLHGFGPDDAISFEDQAESEYDVGADGEITVTVSADESRIVNVTVQPTSPSYKIMSAQAKAQKLAIGVIPPNLFNMTDLGNGDKITDANAIYLNSPFPSKNKKLAPVTFKILLPKPIEVNGALIQGI